MTTLVFPPTFTWGVATSSYQIEGATGEDGRGLSIWDRFCEQPGAVVDASSGAVACEHYHRFGDDVALMKELGVAAYRFSIAWPRVVPNGRGAVNEAGLDFYDRLVDALLAARITPYATLYHWDLPQALEDEGGWPRRDTAAAFAEYAEIVSRRLGDRVPAFITHNEPWCASFLGYQRGVHAPGRRDWTDALAASHHLLLSHGWATEAIRSRAPGCEVGITLNLAPVHAASSSAADHEARRWQDGHFNRWFLGPVFGRGYPEDMIRSYVDDGALPSAGATFVRLGDIETIATEIDFLGVNYYYRQITRSDRVPESENSPRTVEPAPASQWTDMGWEVYPEGLWELLARVHLDYAPKKIFVTENGASFDTAPDASGRIRDVRRLAYLRSHFEQAHRAIEDGIPLAGYFVWSLLDNFEWERGYGQRFGIVWVDYESQRRVLKDSARWYRQVIVQNGLGGSD
jgi:beta-glucosidase